VLTKDLRSFVWTLCGMEKQNTQLIQENLTEEGKAMIRGVAEELVTSIEKDKECVVLWVSPTERTLETARIIRKCLEKGGIDVLKASKVSKVGTLIDLRRPEETLISPYTRQNLTKEEIKKRVSKRQREIAPTKETPEEILTRIRRVLEYAIRASENVRLDLDKKVRIVMVTHLAPIKELLEAVGYIGEDVGEMEKRDQVPVAAHVSIVVQHDAEEKNTILQVRFAGENRPVLFDRQNRAISQLQSSDAHVEADMIFS